MTRFLVSLASAVLGVVLPGAAATINMTYAGTDISLCHCNYLASGTGSFNFADGLTTVTAADLKSFQLVVYETSTLGSDTIQYGMADVRDAQQGALFNLTLDALGVPTGFQMYTDYEGTSTSVPQQSFNVMGLG